MPSQTTTQEDSAAGVAPTAPWRIRAVSVLPDYRLAVTFCDGRDGIIDCSSVLTSTNPGIYAPLAALTWANGANLDPGWLHAELADRKVWFVQNGTKLSHFCMIPTPMRDLDHLLSGRCEKLERFRSSFHTSGFPSSRSMGHQKVGD